MHFITATDKATRASVTLTDIAQACGVSLSKVQRARMDADSPHHRTPPDGWQRCLARLCRERAATLTKLADLIDPEA